MKNTCTCALHTYLTQHFEPFQDKAKALQDSFAPNSLNAIRVDLAEDSCCALHFIYYLACLCDNPNELIRDLRKIICGEFNS